MPESPDAWLLRGDRPERAAPEPRSTPARSRRRRRPILCRRCGEELSDAGEVFAMSSEGAGGVFVNPHGIVHEIVTMRRVRNVVVLGPPTTEFTWFPGYAWEIAWCARCRAHVGWSFAAVGGASPPTFFGLRRDSIVEKG
ncbi:MAG: cereblon family protein [Candidatus Binatia bacterium]